jgi:hypothetical protein
MSDAGEEKKSRKWVWLSLVLLAVILCTLLFAIRYRGNRDDGRIEVYGIVTLNGSRLAAGQILFIPQKDVEGPSAYGRIDDGRYIIEADVGPFEGEYDVRITTGEPPQPPWGKAGSSEKKLRKTYTFKRTVSKSSNEQDFSLPLNSN